MGIRLNLYFSDRAVTDVELFRWIRTVRKTDRQQVVKDLLAQAIAQNPELITPPASRGTKRPVTPRGIRPEQTHSHPQDQTPAPLPAPTVPSLAGFARDMKRTQDPSRHQ